MVMKLLSRAVAAAPLRFAEAGELRLDDLTKRYGEVAALASLTLSIGPGEVVSVTGPSGAGKTTLGRLVSGLEQPGSGRLTMVTAGGAQDFGALPPQARCVAHMFESYALFPTRSVFENIASPLNAPGSQGRWSEVQKRERIDEVLALTEITALRDRLPSQLSGGQKQRAALCRALAQDPSVFVLDEPIGHLDAKLRHTLRGEIRRRQSRLCQGTLWLTPDGVEAMAVGHRVAVLIGGRLQQLGTPDEVFARPANVQVARLIGDPAMNVLPVVLGGGASPRWQVGDAAAVPLSEALFQRLAPQARDGRVLLGLRPADLQVADGAAARSATHEHLPATVYAVEPLGKHTIVTLAIGSERLRAKVAPGARWATGAPVAIGFRAEQALAFDADTGVLLDC